MGGWVVLKVEAKINLILCKCVVWKEAPERNTKALSSPLLFWLFESW